MLDHLIHKYERKLRELKREQLASDKDGVSNLTIGISMELVKDFIKNLEEAKQAVSDSSIF